VLIPSGRHRPEDLELWAELEEADRAHGERLLRSALPGRAAEAVWRFAAGGGVYCGLSHGKDSCVLAHLIHLSGLPVPCVHLRVSPSHNPHCDDVRDALLRLLPGLDYHEIPVDYGDVYRRGLPDDERDALTDRLWRAGFAEAARRFGGRHLSGVRASESGVRKLRMRRWGLSTGGTCCPFGWWTEADVFGYLAAHGLPVHPNYAMLGGGRYPRDRIRVAEIGDVHGNSRGRAEHEEEYFGDVLRRLRAR